MFKYEVKRVLEFKNDKCKTEYLSVGDDIIMGYEDYNEGVIEIKGEVLGIEDDGYLLIYRHKTLKIEKYELCNIIFLIK